MPSVSRRIQSSDSESDPPASPPPMRKRPKRNRKADELEIDESDRRVGNQSQNIQNSE
jgi:hypothetical protein